MALTNAKVEIQFGSSSWVDVAGYGNNIVINRGTTRVMDDYQAGTLNVTFTNNDRTFDPLNTGSILWYGAGGYTMVQPGARIRVTINSSIVFYGWIQDWSFTYDNSGFDGNATVTAGDFMYFISRINFTGSEQYAGQFSGDRISDVLYQYNFPTNKVAFRASKTLIGGDEHQPGDNVLTYLQNVARSEPGDLFASASSSAVMIFKDRTFTDYTWLSSYRQNLIKYPSPNTVDSTDYKNGNGLGDGWINAYISRTASPIYGGTVNGADPNYDGLFRTFYYVENNQAKYNPTASNSVSYVFSGWFRGNALISANGGISGSFSFKDIYGLTLGTPVSIAGTAASAAVWTQLSGTATYSGTGIVSGVNLFISSGGTSSTYDFVGNGWQIEDASTYDGSYFDGGWKPSDSTSGVKKEVSWMGQAYSSPSIFAINTASSTPTPATYLTFADANSQGSSFGNGTAIPFITLELASSGLTLYNQVQIVGTNATATVTDSAGTALYGLKSYSQSDNLTPSLTRPAEIAADVLGMWRLPEYRAQAFTVALEALTTAQQNLVLGLELRDIIRLCFQPSAQGVIVDKYYQILSINTQADIERNHITFMVASLNNIPVRLDSTLTGQLDACILG